MAAALLVHELTHADGRKQEIEAYQAMVEFMDELLQTEPAPLMLALHIRGVAVNGKNRNVNGLVIVSEWHGDWPVHITTTKGQIEKFLANPNLVYSGEGKKFFWGTTRLGNSPNYVTAGTREIPVPR